MRSKECDTCGTCGTGVPPVCYGKFGTGVSPVRFVRPAPDPSRERKRAVQFDPNRDRKGVVQPAVDPNRPGAPGLGVVQFDPSRERERAVWACVTFLSMLALSTGCQATRSLNPVEQANVEPANMFMTVADTDITTQPSTTETKPSTAPAKTATKQARYTAPRAQFQGINFIATALGASAISRTSAGKEAAEAGVTTGSAITGAPGLGAPQARTVEAIVGQPGLQRGFPIGFGLIPSQNIFTRTINPITGPNSACSALVNAGFFTNPTACQTRFRR